MNVGRFFRSTSSRTFVVIPLSLLLLEWLLHGKQLQLQPLGLPLLVWGYLQYRLAGSYRTRLGGGGPGFKRPPERLVTSGIFAYTRNPMYLGHLIFLTGLAVTLRSYAGAGLALLHIPWFQNRVMKDESRLHEIFGAEYAAYTRKVKRWVPYAI